MFGPKIVSPERIKQILAEIERQKSAKKDFIGDSRKFRVIDAEGQLALTLEGEESAFSFKPNGQRQLVEFAKIPGQWFRRMADADIHRAEIARMATHMLQTEPGMRMVRTLDGEVRAFLSNGYRTLDNADLFFIAVDEFKKAGAEIIEARLTENNFRLYAVAPGLCAEVKQLTDAGERPSSWRAGEPDMHYAACRVSNSETGSGKLKVEPTSFRGVCDNWLILDQSLAKIHLGRKVEEEGWISDETRKMDDRVIWAKVRDIIKATFDPKMFQKVIATLESAAQDKVADPVKAIDAAVEVTGLPKSSIDAIRQQFFNAQDYTRYGLVNAITDQSKRAESDEDKDAFDEAGQKVLATTIKQLSR